MSKLSRRIAGSLIGPQVGDRVCLTQRGIVVWGDYLRRTRGGIVTEVGPDGDITIKLKNKVGWNKDGARPGVSWCLWPGEYEVITEDE